MFLLSISAKESKNFKEQNNRFLPLSLNEMSFLLENYDELNAGLDELKSDIYKKEKEENELLKEQAALKTFIDLSAAFLCMVRPYDYTDGNYSVVHGIMAADKRRISEYEKLSW